MKLANYLNYICCLFILLFCYSCQDKYITLIDNNVVNCEIVYLGDTNRHNYQSAEILQKYLQKITDVKIDITDESSQTSKEHKIYVGKDLNENLLEHEILIKTDNQNVFIAGGSDHALKNAVYEFLERYLNCKWYAPGVDNIPNLKSIILPLNIDYKYNPEIKTRTVHSKLFYNNHDFADKHKVTYEAFPFYVPQGRVHTFHRFIPEEQFYKSNPEYFALRGNKRLPTQLCLTNKKVLEIVKDSVQALFDRYPESSVISVSSNDNTQYCECDNCKKIDDDEDSHAGTMIRFVNEVAKQFPDKTISTLAYQYTRKPCKTKPLDNVLITLCSIECDRSAPITEKCIDFADDIKGWSKLTDNIRIWDYTTQFTNFLAPFPNFHTLKPNIQFFRDYNTKWVFEQHSHNPSELFELRSYIMAKLLWNPDAELDGIITEFINGYYQEAGVYIKEYVDTIHEQIKNYPDFFLFLYGDPSQAFNSYLSSELLSKYGSLFDSAERAVSNKPEVLKRVKIARLGIDYAVLEACRKNLSKEYSLSNVDFVQELLDNFENNCSDGNVILMNEMGFTVDEYINGFNNAIQVSKQPNKAYEKKVTLLTKPKKYANEDPQTLTDGALGGSSFYSNWLGFEGNDMEAIIDLEKDVNISEISMAFLQVTNHIVFFPAQVKYYGSSDNKDFKELGKVINEKPLTKSSKINDIQYFNLRIDPVKIRYLKVKAENLKNAPYWHHAAGLPSWIFADEIIIN